MQRELQNKIEKTEGGDYIITTENQYSAIIRDDNIIVAYSKKRREIVIYDQDFIMVCKIAKISAVENYLYDKYAKFCVFEQYESAHIIVLHNGNYTTVKLTNNYGDHVEFSEIKSIAERLYLVVGEYRPYLEGYGYCGYTYVFFMINLNEGATFFQKLENQCNTYLLQSQRFLICHGMYDLYTMTKMELPKDLKGEFDVEVCYSVQQIMVVKILNTYYVYVKGKIIHSYSSEEEHKQVLLELKNNYAVFKRCSTLFLKDKIWVWSKDEQPESMRIPK